MTSYIEFELVEKKPKTDVYHVVNTNENIVIGMIRWYGAWRKYCFFPEDDIVLSGGCLHDIEEFINELMEKRK